MSSREAMQHLERVRWNDTAPFNGAGNGVDMAITCLEAADSILNCLDIAFDLDDGEEDIRNIHVSGVIRGTKLLIALAGASIEAGDRSGRPAEATGAVS